MDWDLPIVIDERLTQSVAGQIARAISDGIVRGRLRAGERIPGSRPLANVIGVHRNTVLAAVETLRSEGWIETSRARGTFVAEHIPEPPPRATAGTRKRPGALETSGFAFETGSQPPAIVVLRRGVFALSAGVPDLRLAPVNLLARAWRRALLSSPRALLGYGDPRGDPRLRAALAKMLRARRGMVVDADHIVVTRGSQMALDLLARTVLRPGDRVAIESYGYRPAWNAFRAAGATLAPIPVDADGLKVEALEEAHAAAPVRAVYVTPHHQYPTTVGMSASRRLALLDFARRHRVPVIEDDYDHEFHYDGRPVLPLASVDRAGVVLYVGTLSKIVAPGLRVGFLAAPRDFIDRIADVRATVDRQGDQVTERALAELLEEGEIQRHVRRLRRVLSRRRDACIESLQTTLGGRVTFRIPAGGMSLWLRARGGTDVDAWAVRASERGVEMYTAKRFAFDGRARPYVRCVFAGLNEREMRDAIERLRAAWVP